MADELRINLRATFTGENGHVLKVDPAGTDTTYDLATAATFLSASGVQTIGTGGENLNKGEIGAANVGYCYLKNIDPTNYCDFVVTIRCAPGEIAFFKPAPSTEIAGTANTAATNIEYKWGSK